MSKLELDFEFKNEEGFYKSPDNSIWINSKTKKVEDTSDLEVDYMRFGLKNLKNVISFTMLSLILLKIE